MAVKWGGNARSHPDGVREFTGDTPSPPSDPGCYHYTKTEGWVSVPCLSQAQVQALPPPGTNHIPGIEYRKLGKATPKYPIISKAYVEVTFVQFSGETDTSFGSGAFSIQTNTNLFTGLNKHLDWVQFVLQYFGGDSPPHAFAHG